MDGEVNVTNVLQRVHTTVSSSESDQHNFIQPPSEQNDPHHGLRLDDGNTLFTEKKRYGQLTVLHSNGARVILRVSHKSDISRFLYLNSET